MPETPGIGIVLTSSSTYENKPEDAWERIKVRTDKPKVLAFLKQYASGTGKP